MSGSETAAALETLRRAAAAGGRRGHRPLVAEGTRLNERALRSGLRPDPVLVTDAFFHSDEPRMRDLLMELTRSGSSVLRVSREQINSLTQGRGFGEIVSLVPAPTPADPTRLLQGGATSLLVLVDVADAGNAGALVRTAHACGAAGVLATGSTDLFHPKAVRTSMGSLFRLPVAYRERTQGALDEVVSAGGELIATVSGGGESLPVARFGPKCAAVVVGSEAFGLDGRPELRCARPCTIPMPEGVDSLSVNAAAAITLYAVAQQRRLR